MASQKKKVTFNDIAKYTNFSKTTISRYFNNPNSLTLKNQEIIAKALVDSPDEVVVTEKETDKTIVLELKVATDDVGKIIGKQGKIAKAIRSVVKAASSKCDKKVIVDII